MSNKLLQDGHLVIGMIHFMPLLGIAKYSSIEKILAVAQEDLRALEAGGVDAIMVENNYDLPHHITVGPETVAAMTYLLRELQTSTTKPFGVSVLWNDYQAALSIAKVCGASFVRVPVFVDHVRTSYGEVRGDPRAVTDYRAKIGAEDVALLTDIHVKHAEILNTDTIIESAKQAQAAGSDALILTGKWTGDLPELAQLQAVKEASPGIPLLVGSGAASDNITAIKPYIDGVIISTAIKKGGAREGEINVKGYDQRIDPKKVRDFVATYSKDGAK